ncbi:CheR family methyltransferase [Candidatus Magnetominusculus xianensis]|uniref:Chemotaxis protein CheR n=1 Tax=Candidatus Magnetominusculus xianensis TaxID=1748249 RepID=A0ABR5SI42_9BACT|nr:protein-glutamate O-methyltransferase CheR [Candidatus Magnetominusculus xianensis]KWT91956.1 chemotaxis protein CheR [Candidatus Magnetominusculus xianensis]MBF0403229.1 protein-glutamate O-methyltransferase CheR [Nitrospirota bacterium]
MDYYDDNDNENLEVMLLLEAVNAKYGYDFRSYARASIKRRIRHRMSVSGIKKITEVIERLIYDKSFFTDLLGDFSISTTEMFRDPGFFQALRKTVFPVLQRLPFIKIWVAGCSTGEEVYSLAILLREEKLYEKSMIYATDYCNKSLTTAKEGIYNIKSIKKYAANYIQAGGIQSFSDYFKAEADSAAIDPSLRQNMVFSIHNLAADGVFGEMNIILCRNVLIYFNRELQNKVFGLFTQSLEEGGYLCLGSKETIRLSTYSDNYDEMLRDEKIYRRNSAPVSYSKPSAHPVATPEFVTKGGELIRDVKAKMEELDYLLNSVGSLPGQS